MGEEVYIPQEVLEEMKEISRSKGTPLDDIFSTYVRWCKQENERCKAPPGKFRVVCLDKVCTDEFVQGDYDSPEKAIKIAENLTRQEMIFAVHEEPKIYHAYDDQGNYLGGFKK